jgi:CxxC motif-containing protein (DUF1111 family)
VIPYKTSCFGAILLLVLSLEFVFAFESAVAGGGINTTDTSYNAFSHPLKKISKSHLDDFYVGQSFFKRPWVSAPASTKARDGLGPIFNANSCHSCHVRNGRGRLPEGKEKIRSALIRLSTQDKKSQATIPNPIYGDQIQPYSADNKIGEATPQFTYSEITGEFDDGESYTLIKPTVFFTDWQYGLPEDTLLTSIRVAPVLIGMGLLDAIPEAEILSYSDPEDLNKDGISGRANEVLDIQNQHSSLGRFGWKASQPSLLQQVASAFRNDMGITSELFSDQPCLSLQFDCLSYPHGGTPEIVTDIFRKVVIYTALLAVPKQRKPHDSFVRQGKILFDRLKCSACHRPAFKTGSHNLAELANQNIFPYTDLLLHDMGEGLADHRPDFVANGREWRTPPLWGIGLVKKVNGHQRFLHDGRARGLMEAILWHGGEAEYSRQQVLKLTKSQRQVLLTFLQSL